MASISRDEKTGIYRLQFRDHVTGNGKPVQKSLKTTDEKAAEATRSRVEEMLGLLERGRLGLPPVADLWEFLKTDGRRS